MVTFQISVATDICNSGAAEYPETQSRLKKFTVEWSTQNTGERVSRVEWWCDRPHASLALPVGTCSINCCLHRACSLQTISIACIKEKPHAELYEIFIHSVHFSSPFPSFFLFLFPTLLPPSFFKALPPNKKTRKTSFSRVFRLDFLPAQKRSSISLVLSQPASLLYLPGARIWLGMGGGIKKKKKGGATSRMVGMILHGGRWETNINWL